MNKLNTFDWVALVLVVVGGLNWGLVGLFNFDLVAFIFASIPLLAQAVYVVVALAAIYLAAIAMNLSKK